jgi:hypothetical protein
MFLEKLNKLGSLKKKMFQKAKRKALFCNAALKWTLPLLVYYST